MRRIAIRFGFGVAFLIALIAQLPAQPPKKDGPPPKDGAPKKDDGKKDDGKKDGKKPPAKSGEEYRQFFKQPENVAEYWKAMRFEMEVGRFDLAAKHLHGLLEKANEEELLELEQQEGLTTFHTLRQVRKWDDNARLDKQAKQDLEKLITDMTKAVNARLSNEQLIAKHVKALGSEDPDDRAYALAELYRGGTRSIAALVKQLRESKGDERRRIVAALPKLKPETVPPLLAALAIDDNALRVDLIEAIHKRGDRRLVPHLWYFAGSKRMPGEVRAKATDALSSFLDVPADRLPQAKVALTREAEKYYKHQIAFPDRERVPVWYWDGKNLVSSNVSASSAEEYYGLTYARQALDLDPAYQPAQSVFLSLALEKASEPLGLDQPLTKGPPAINELLATVNPELVTAVLNRALTDHRPAVILGAARALGALAEIRANRPTGRGEPALVRALNYPDRRVQLVAADALLRIPGLSSPPATTRIVEVLRRTAAAEPVSKILIADANRQRAMLVADAVKKAGFEPVVATSGHDALRQLKEAADIDAVLIDRDIPDPQLRDLLAQLRADVNVGLLPIIITEAPGPAPEKPKEPDKEQPKEKEPEKDKSRFNKETRDDSPAAIQRRFLAAEAKAREAAAKRRADRNLNELIKQYPNVTVAPATTDANILKRLLTERIANDMGRPLSPGEVKDIAAATTDRLKRLAAERADHSDRALTWLGRLARGEPAGYDLRLAADTLMETLRSGKHSNDALAGAIAAVGKLPGAKLQGALADFVIDGKAPVPLRAAAATELVRHIQQNGRALNPNQVRSLEALAKANETDAALKTNVTLVLGAMRPDSRKTGERLKGYVPGPATPPEKKDKP
jgi:CheY-like chemotaxis protein